MISNLPESREATRPPGRSYQERLRGETSNGHSGSGTDKAQHKCENCGRDIEFSDMQVGHKTAYSRGGHTTLKNAVALYYGCHKKQGTDSWEVFQRKQGKTVALDRVRDVLSELSPPKLKYLVSKHGIKLKGTLVEGGLFSSDYRKASSKKRYVKELAKVVSENEITSDLNEMPPTPAKRKRKWTSDPWFER